VAIARLALVASEAGSRAIRLVHVHRLACARIEAFGFDGIWTPPLCKDTDEVNLLT